MTIATLHERIYADLEGHILSGAWPPGRRIPVESELTGIYGCSRMTVNKAISELATRGLVTRRRRAGTFVARPRAHAAVLAIPDLRAEIENRGSTYKYQLLSRRERDAANAQEQVLAAGDRLLALDCLHLSDEMPLAIERRLIALAAAPGARDADFTTTPPGNWLLEASPWNEAEHRILSVGADTLDARLLKVRLGEPCLRVERRTWWNGRPVTQVSQTFPGDRYDLVARFSPARGGA